MTKVKANISYERIGIQGHGHPVRALGDDLPVVDRDMLAKLRLEELRQQLPKCSALSFICGFRSSSQIQIRRGIYGYLTHASLRRSRVDMRQTIQPKSTRRQARGPA
jgi:hypothetical protein